MRGGAAPVFSADPAHVSWFGSRIVRQVQSNPPGRILDIGCGDGALLRYLANAFPAAALVGVDLAGAVGAQEGITFVRGDYLALDAGRFDLIVASSSLQGIETKTDRLAAKIARDAAPTASVMHVTPYRCAYNTALNSIRRVLRVMRGGATDRMILMTARALHPSEPQTRLVQRVDYMYLILQHYEDDLRRALGQHGFALNHTERAPHTSPGQPKHRFAVMSRPAR